MTQCEPHELLEELYPALLSDVLRRLRQPRPPAELLAIARTICNAAGVQPDEAQRRLLVRLRRRHLAALLEALTDPERPPTASVLAEVRHVLASTPMADLSADVETREEAVKLIRAGLPFKTH